MLGSDPETRDFLYRSQPPEVKLRLVDTDVGKMKHKHMWIYLLTYGVMSKQDQRELAHVK